jgi:fatty acid desaturase
MQRNRDRSPARYEANAYREYLRAAAFPREVLAAAHKINDRRAIIDFFCVIATTAAVPWLYLAYPSWITVVACILLSIHNFNALTQVGHSSGHGSLLSNRRWNEIVGEIACALRGLRCEGFTVAHQMHHAYLNEEHDGDLLFGRPDEPTRRLLLMCLQDVFLITAIQRVIQLMQTDRKTYEQRPWQHLSVRFFRDRIGMLLPLVAAQLVLVGYYWLVIGPEYYIYFYALPLATLYPVQIRLRSACEHSFEAGYNVAANGRWVTRSVNANVVERFLIGPLYSDYHFEHHLLPTVPYYNLPVIRHYLENKGIQVPLNKGYLAYILQRWREERRLGYSEQTIQ